MFKERLPSGGTLTYLTREDWGATGARKGYAVDNAQFDGLVIHHPVTVWDDEAADYEDEGQAMRRLKVSRPDLGLDIPYSFVLFVQANPLDVVVAEGRGFGRTGAHTAGFNSKRYGVAAYGNFENDQPTTGLIEGIRWVGSKLEGTPVPTIGHRDLRATACPGEHLYARLDELQPPFASSPTESDEDMELAARVRELEAAVYLGGDPDTIVENAYRKVLGRPSDEAGKAHWLGFVQGGGSVADMLDLFRMSPEANQ